MYLADFRLLHENIDFGITELCLANLELVKKATEVDPGELARYDRLRGLGLRWSRQPDHDADEAHTNFDQGLSKIDTEYSAVLQRLQPHANLSALEIRCYQGATFCAWMSNANLYVPNLVKIELVGMPRCERLPSLGQLANLEELRISDMPNIREVDSSFYGGKHPFRRLRELHIDGIGNLEVWSTNLEPYAGQMSWNDNEQQLQGDEIFPSLEHLIIRGCPRLTLDSGFQGRIRRIVGSCSGLSISPQQITADSRAYWRGNYHRIEVEANIRGLSDGSELLPYSINLSKLTIKFNSDLITLPGGVQKCQNLRCLQILDCWNFSVLPDWLGDLTSLEELEVHAPKLQRLPHAIKGLTSLKTLTLKQCNYKLRERCSISGEDYEKIERIKCHAQGLEVSVSSSTGVDLLEKTTSHQLIELDIKDLQHLSRPKAEKINLLGKEELQLLSLEWSSKCDVVDKAALQELQPHQNLRRLFIKNYPIDAGFPHWMQSLPNLLVSLELSNVQGGHLHLDHLQNLEDLHVSSLSFVDRVCNLREIKNLYAGSSLLISSTQPLKKLRRVTIARVGKLVWETSTSRRIEQGDDNKFQRLTERTADSNGQPSENILPGLEYLEIDSCLEVRFEPSIPRSSRYKISGSNLNPWLFRWPSFKQVMGLSTSASSSNMEIKYYSVNRTLPLTHGQLDITEAEKLASIPLGYLVQLNIVELTVECCTDLSPLPECIQDWKSLKKLEILNCVNIETLPADRMVGGHGLSP